MGTYITATHDRRGFSLLESLIALALCGLLLVGVIQGLFTTVTTSTASRDHSTAETRLTAVSDRFKVLASGAGFYTDCAGPSQLEAAFEADPGDALGDAGLDVVSVQFWNGTSYVSTVSTCPTKDQGIQLLTLRVAIGSTSATGVVVIRDPWAAS